MTHTLTAGGALDGGPPHPALTVREVHDAVEGNLATIVVLKDTAGHVRRRTFLTLAAAQRAVDRAHQRGQDAVIGLVRLQVVGRLGSPPEGQ